MEEEVLALGVAQVIESAQRQVRLEEVSRLEPPVDELLRDGLRLGLGLLGGLGQLLRNALWSELLERVGDLLCNFPQPPPTSKRIR